jgi:hypothetical protein
MDSPDRSAKGRFSRFLTAAAKIFGALLLGLVLVVLVLMWSCAAPSDGSLNKRLKRHRAEFDALSRMSQQDAGVLRIADDFIGAKGNWAWPRPEAEWGIPSDRWDQYRRLFRAAGISSGLAKDESGNVYFIVHTQGLAIGGSTKGLVHCFSAAQGGNVFLPCGEQHDRGQDGDNSEGSSYRKIEADWYVFEEWH